ncbi:helix-turn-helix domain-containing protein [Candidatus Microgenomates bacterium]|nr:MAG: helix-turn-helix domain-containing protein [Candidatus Microgenomates bacterium]
MTRFADRQEVIKLRKQGRTYSEIKKELSISKSTLSDWLSGLYLTDKQIRSVQKRTQKNKELAVEKYRITMQLKRETRLQKIYEIQKKFSLPLSERELKIAGLFLYWGEGKKSLKSSVSVSNTDPQILLFVLYWLTKIMKVPKLKIKVYLHLYDDMNIQEELNYWSQLLKISLSQFNNPYIKKSKREDIDQKGFGHGTCSLIVNDVRLKEKIIMAIKAMGEYYGGKI